MLNIKNNIAIKVEGLSKKYALGKKNTELKISDKIKELFKQKKHITESEKEFFALKNIDFEIYKGETIGIIGRNGAGKSTLLKVLSRITEPSEGRIILNGTVASVLEVGMGFHPELTGRENVFLSGAMLGIPKSKITEKFDDIVEFAGMQRFIDTAVKHYSSGMYVRLAFSVVVNIEADILLFDEVLSVGDYSFQMKCYDKITKLANSNKTIVIVSHNNNDILRLCSKVMILNKGHLTDFGDTSMVMKYFEQSISESPAINEKEEKNNKEISIKEYNFENTLKKEWTDISEAPGDEKIKIRKVFIENETRKGDTKIFTSDKFSINFEYEKFYDNDYYDIGFIFSNMNYMFLGNHFGNSDQNMEDFKLKGTYNVKAVIEEKFFNNTIVSLGFG
ncbi:MAG: ABC transporter ATP-binding protein, partial [Bacteroidales bacterium]|nr:ABC transporter ATP-binding protein [Bacteroidales bacterium]